MVMFKIFVVFSTLALTSWSLEIQMEFDKVLCFYENPSTQINQKTVSVGIEDIKSALDKCTDLIFNTLPIFSFLPGSVTPELQKHFNSLNSSIFLELQELKKMFPKLKIIISISSPLELSGKNIFDVLNIKENRESLITSTKSFLKKYNFDGINLFWLFPTKEDKIKTKKQEVVSVDPHPEENKRQFGEVVQDFAKSLKSDNLLTYVMVLPHIDYTLYYDIPMFNKFVDLVILYSHEFPSASNMYDVEDKQTRMYYASARKSVYNIEKKSKYFLEHGLESHKIVITIPTYGSWSVVKTEDIESEPNQNKKMKPAYGGIINYYQLCSQIQYLKNPNLTTPGTTPKFFLNVIKNNLGVKYFDTNGNIKDEYIIWYAFENPESAQFKKMYAKNLKFAGVAVENLNSDDFTGICGKKFPMLEALA